MRLKKKEKLVSKTDALRAQKGNRNFNCMKW